MSLPEIQIDALRGGTPRDASLDILDALDGPRASPPPVVPVSPYASYAQQPYSSGHKQPHAALSSGSRALGHDFVVSLKETEAREAAAIEASNKKWDASHPVWRLLPYYAVGVGVAYATEMVAVWMLRRRTLVDVGVVIALCIALVAVVIVSCCTRSFYADKVRQVAAATATIATAVGLVGALVGGAFFQDYWHYSDVAGDVDAHMHPGWYTAYAFAPHTSVLIAEMQVWPIDDRNTLCLAPLVTLSDDATSAVGAAVSQSVSSAIASSLAGGGEASAATVELATTTAATTTKPVALAPEVDVNALVAKAASKVSEVSAADLLSQDEPAGALTVTADGVPVVAVPVPVPVPVSATGIADPIATADALAAAKAALKAAKKKVVPIEIASPASALPVDALSPPGIASAAVARGAGQPGEGAGADAGGGKNAGAKARLRELADQSQREAQEATALAVTRRQATAAPATAPELNIATVAQQSMETSVNSASSMLPDKVGVPIVVPQPLAEATVTDATAHDETPAAGPVAAGPEEPLSPSAAQNNVTAEALAARAAENPAQETTPAAATRAKLALSQITYDAGARPAADIEGLRGLGGAAVADKAPTMGVDASFVLRSNPRGKGVTVDITQARNPAAQPSSQPKAGPKAAKKGIVVVLNEKKDAPAAVVTPPKAAAVVVAPAGAASFLELESTTTKSPAIASTLPADASLVTPVSRPVRPFSLRPSTFTRYDSPYFVSNVNEQAKGGAAAAPYYYWAVEMNCCSIETVIQAEPAATLVQAAELSSFLELDATQLPAADPVTAGAAVSTPLIYTAPGAAAAAAAGGGAVPNVVVSAPTNMAGVKTVTVPRATCASFANPSLYREAQRRAPRPMWDSALEALAKQNPDVHVAKSHAFLELLPANSLRHRQNDRVLFGWLTVTLLPLGWPVLAALLYISVTCFSRCMQRSGRDGFTLPKYHASAVTA